MSRQSFSGPPSFKFWFEADFGKVENNGPREGSERSGGAHFSHHLLDWRGLVEEWLQHLGVRGIRDYMVMEPTKDWTKVTRKFVTPSGLSSLIAKLLSTLSCPRRSGLGWELMPHVLLLPDGLEAFISGCGSHWVLSR